MRKTSASLQPRKKVVFNPENEEHLIDFAYFIKYNKWKSGCGYLLEDPFLDVPAMISSKLVKHFLSCYMPAE